jgi:phospholipase C
MGYVRAISASRLRLLCLVAGLISLVIAVAGIGATTQRVAAEQPLASPGPPACASGVQCGPITHVVFMVKENRTFDDMFGRFPGVNGATTYVAANGAQKPLAHQADSLSSDLGHTIKAAREAIDGGKMDGFRKVRGAVQHGVDVADSQFYGSDIPNYWRYAQTFAIADRFFSSALSESFPNHFFTIAANAKGVMNNPTLGGSWGCDAPPSTRVKQLLPGGTARRVYPCFQMKTITDVLDARDIPWRYYAPSFGQRGYIWSSLDAIRHIRNSAEWKSNVVSYSQFAPDAQAGNLPAVSWLVSPPWDSDHPPFSICEGENWTVDQINAVMSNAEEWKHTAIIVVWDDFGGFYDHVAPPAGPNPSLQYGPRVPALIISPYARPSFVDHTFYTLSSLLKLADTVLGLPALPGTDLKPGDLSNAFDFSQAPRAPLVLSARTCPPSPWG